MPAHSWLSKQGMGHGWLQAHKGSLYTRPRHPPRALKSEKGVDGLGS